jgi:hypothetical protein
VPPQRAKETKVFLLLFLQKKKTLLFLKEKKQKNFMSFAAAPRLRRGYFFGSAGG